jgi:hypothetical protein
MRCFEPAIVEFQPLPCKRGNFVSSYLKHLNRETKFQARAPWTNIEIIVRTVKHHGVQIILQRREAVVRERIQFGLVDSVVIDTPFMFKILGFYHLGRREAGKDYKDCPVVTY